MPGPGTANNQRFWMHVLNRQDVYEFYRPLDKFWLGSASEGFRPNPEFIDFLLQQPRVLANLSTEHWGDDSYPMCHYMHDVTTAHPKFLILSHDPRHHGIKHNIFYFPFFLNPENYKFTRAQEVLHNQRHIYIGYVNAVARPHRVRMARLISTSELRDKSFLTWPSGDLPHPLHDIEDEKFYETMPRAHSHPLDQSTSITDHEVDWTPYRDCFLHVISESSWRDGIFLTEKTWKCMLAGTFFVMSGGRHSVAHVRSLGFDTFDDIIPHDRYDGVEGYAARCDALFELLLELQHLDWPNIYQETTARRLENQKRFMQGSAYQPYIDQIETFFQI